MSPKSLTYNLMKKSTNNNKPTQQVPTASGKNRSTLQTLPKPQPITPDLTKRNKRQKKKEKVIVRTAQTLDEAKKEFMDKNGKFFSKAKQPQQKRRFPVDPLAAHIIDPWQYPPRCWPDREVLPTSLIEFNLTFQLTFSRVMNAASPPVCIGHAATLLLGGRIVNVGGVMHNYGCNPPVSVTNNIVVGATNNGNDIFHADLMETCVSLLTPATTADMTGIISRWRTVSMSFKTTNNTNLVNRQGDITAFATPYGNSENFCAWTTIDSLSYKSLFSNSLNVSATSNDVMASVFPTDVKYLQYHSPEDEQNDLELPDVSSGCIGMIFWLPTSDATIASQQDVSCSVRVVMESVPESTKINLMPTSITSADGRKMDNIFNLMSTETCLHESKGGVHSQLAMGKSVSDRRPSNASRSKITTLLENGRVQVSEIVRTDEAPVITASSGGGASSLWTSVKPVLETIDKYAPAVLDVLGAFGL